jgi:hypothetical protein
VKTVIELSPEQQRVVDYRDGHLQVIACAGSGKTESISRRVAHLIAEGPEPASSHSPRGSSMRGPVSTCYKAAMGCTFWVSSLASGEL